MSNVSLKTNRSTLNLHGKSRSSNDLKSSRRERQKLAQDKFARERANVVLGTLPKSDAAPEGQQNPADPDPADPAYFSLAPRGTSSRNPASTGLPSGSEAANSIPFDSSPRILRGARFATMTILRPISFSGS